MGKDIELGDKVRDRVTGLEGIAVCVATWLNGCVRVTVQPQQLKDGTPVENCCLDLQQLELRKKAVVPNAIAKPKPASTGGDRPDARRGQETCVRPVASRER